jgi:hypothetical protein
MKRIKCLTMLFVVLCASFQASAEQAQCLNGKPYQLTRIFVEMDGKVVQAYEYQGPLGKGYILSNVPYEQAKAYVCKETKAQWLPDDNMGE